MYCTFFFKDRRLKSNLGSLPLADLQAELQTAAQSEVKAPVMKSAAAICILVFYCVLFFFLLKVHCQIESAEEVALSVQL